MQRQAGAAEKTEVCRSKLKAGDDSGHPSVGHDQRGCGKRLPKYLQEFFKCQLASTDSREGFRERRKGRVDQSE